MKDPRGLLRLDVDGKEYKLHMGMSVLADLQAKHGQDVLARLDAPEGAPVTWVPDLAIVVDMIRLSLRRYHADEDTSYAPDDIFACHPSVAQLLVSAAFLSQEELGNDQKADLGNGKKMKRAS